MFMAVEHTTPVAFGLWSRQHVSWDSLLDLMGRSRITQPVHSRPPLPLSPPAGNHHGSQEKNSFMAGSTLAVLGASRVCKDRANASWCQVLESCSSGFKSKRSGGCALGGLMLEEFLTTAGACQSNVVCENDHEEHQYFFERRVRNILRSSVVT